jgi:hypothetical protein
MAVTLLVATSAEIPLSSLVQGTSPRKCKFFVTTNLEKKERETKNQKDLFFTFTHHQKKNDNINQNLHVTQENNTIIIL